MASEPRRGCGYRKMGGLYIITRPGRFVVCDRMPIKFEDCEHCEAMGFHCGFKPSRGWTWFNPQALLKGDHYIHKPESSWMDRILGERQPLLCPENFCYVCRPEQMGDKAGLLWINPRHYSTAEFVAECMSLGMSRRIAGVPRGFETGKTVVFFAHKEVGGIFLALRPTGIEKIVPADTDAHDAEELRKKGITPVRIPANDPDHK